jgi:fructosamine-3-kinase
MRAAPEGFVAALQAAFRAANRSAPVPIALEPVSGGSINRAFVLRAADGVWFCKWNDGAPGDFFRREAEGLEALRAAGSPLIIPRTVALWPDEAGPDRVGPALLVLEYLEPDADAPSRADWEGFGRGLAGLHAAPEAEFGWSRDNYCGLTPQANGWSADWASFYARRRIAPLVDRLGARGVLDAAARRDFGNLIERLPVLLAHRPRPALIHGDLWSGNFLMTLRGPGLIDPAAYCADPEAEWGMMSLFGGFPDAVRSAYEEILPLPAGWRERQPLYQLYHLLNHAVLFGSGYVAQSLSLARRFL